MSTTNNLSSLISSKSNEKFTLDKASTGASSRWLESDDQRMRIVKYPSGYEADHTCYEGHAFYVLSGNITIHLGEEITEWNEGDGFIIPDKIPHVVTNPYDEVAKIVVVD